MYKIVIIDTICNKSYDSLVYGAEALGGSEATALRVAKMLSNTHAVALEQHNREAIREESHTLRFTPLKTEQNADIVILMRVMDYYKEAKERFPRAKFVLWMHDWATDRSFPNPEEAKDLYKLCVSETHKNQVLDYFKYKYNYPERLFDYKIRYIHNLLESNLPEIVPYNKHKLCFISSPHKGYMKTMRIFEMLREINPNFQLYVANPGYYPNGSSDVPGVVDLGQRPHASLMENIKDSLCLFYPNDIFPETFGLVAAEANAMGIPVMTYRLGALPEVISVNPNQYIKSDALDQDIINKIIYWSEGNRPFVRKNGLLSETKIKRNWERFIMEVMQ